MPFVLLGALALKTSGERPRHQLREYFVLEVNRNFIVEKDVDLGSPARERGMLSKWEVLEAD